MTPLSSRPPAQLSVLAALWLTSVAIVLSTALLWLVGACWGWIAGLPISEAVADAQTSVPLLTVVQTLAMGTAIALGVRGVAEPARPRETLALAPVLPASLCVLFGAGSALQLPLSELSNLLYEHVFTPLSLEEQQALAGALDPESSLARAGVLLCLAVIVPTVEELLFRGVILQGLRPAHGRAGAVLISAALFGLCHVRPVPVVYAFAAGLLLGAVALATGSVLASIAMHAGVNALPIVLGARRWPMPGFNLPTAGVQHLSPALTLGGLFAAGALTAAGLWWNARRR